MSNARDTAGSADKPRVAVVIPCYNHGAYLRVAVESVQRQTYPRIECVVVDDGSTEEATRRVVVALESEGVRVIRQENAGLPAARNAGVRATDAPLFVPLDADDKLHPRFVERLLAVVSKDPRLGYAYCRARLFGARGGTWRCPAYDPYRLLLHSLCTATALIRRDAFEEVGGYQSDMVHGYEDWDFWLALLAAKRHGRLLPEALFYYRQHAAGVSMLAGTEANREVMIRRMIAHHRALYCALLGLDDAGEERVFRELAAAVELDRIERSAFWRLLHPFSARETPPGGRDVPPSQRLAEVKSAAAYRLIASVKRTRLHKWYAKWRYGAA